jgi:hypothetical protein
MMYVCSFLNRKISRTSRNVRYPVAALKPYVGTESSGCVVVFLVLCSRVSFFFVLSLSSFS